MFCKNWTWYEKEFVTVTSTSVSVSIAQFNDNVCVNANKSKHDVQNMTYDYEHLQYKCTNQFITTVEPSE